MNELTGLPGTTETVDRLPGTTPNGRARASALRHIDRGLYQPASMVTYRSAGHVLIVGAEDEAWQAANALGRGLHRIVLVTGERPATPRRQTGGDPDGADGITLVYGRLLELTGYLGEFQARVATTGAEVDLASLAGAGRDRFDLVLDLTSPAFIRREIPPPGYYAPGTDGEARRRALSEIPEMVGEFEKPRFFHYNPDICAHGASGVKGCTRCLEVCPTFAISSLGDEIAVNPHLCQGAGSCATACPTGAITYAYPPVSDLLDTVRTLLKSYRAAGGRNPQLLFHDRETGRQMLATVMARLPEWVIPYEVEELGAVGMETWLGALAYGASGVALLAPAVAAPSVIHELRNQLEYAAAILEGMGHPRELLQFIAPGDAADLIKAQAAPGAEIVPANFSAQQDKRTTIRLAVDHLYVHAPRARRAVVLPAGAPFGEIRVNRETCTLCMACVGVCPASALSDGVDLPQLIFRESNCVQCGLCAAACPEQAITLAPRFVYDPALRQQTRIVNEQQAFCCVVCGKPFATQAIMERMTEKLKGHWMFQTPDALKRLQMCEDCRVKEMLRSAGGLVDVHREP